MLPVLLNMGFAASGSDAPVRHGSSLGRNARAWVVRYRHVAIFLVGLAPWSS